MSRRGRLPDQRRLPAPTRRQPRRASIGWWLLDGPTTKSSGEMYFADGDGLVAPQIGDPDEDGDTCAAVQVERGGAVDDLRRDRRAAQLLGAGEHEREANALLEAPQAGVVMLGGPYRAGVRVGELG